MAQFALPPTDKHTDPPTVVDGEVVALVDIAPASPANLPAVRECICGNVTIRGHNGFTCEQVLDIRARIQAGIRAEERRPVRRLFKWLGR